MMFRDAVMLGVLALVLASATAAQGKQHLRIGTVMLEPWLKVDNITTDSGSETRQTGFIPDLLRRLSKEISFTYDLTVRDDQIFGHISANGSWNGLVGDILANKTDMGAAAITETAERRSVVDFSTPFMSFGSVAILKKQRTRYESLSNRLGKIFLPFSTDVWMTVSLAWLITSAVLYVVCHINPYEWRRLCKDQQATMREGEMSSCPNVFWFTVSTFFLQGFIRAPRSLGGRIISVAWWHYVLLLIIMYMASMTNYLRVGPLRQDHTIPEFRSVADLADQTKVKFGVLNKGASLDGLENSKDSKLEQMASRISRYESTVEQGIQRVRNSYPFGSYAFITESAMAMYYAKQMPCDIYMVGKYQAAGHYAFAFPSGSSLAKDVDMALLKMRHDGTLEALTDKWFHGQCTDFLFESNKKDMFEVQPFVEVDLANVSGCLMILVGGIVLGCLATVVEILIFKQAEKAKLSAMSSVMETDLI